MKMSLLGRFSTASNLISNSKTWGTSSEHSQRQREGGVHPALQGASKDNGLIPMGGFTLYIVIVEYAQLTHLEWVTGRRMNS